MATKTILHNCGHESDHTLYGKHTDRDRKVAYLQTQPCPKCKRDAADSKAKEAISGIELPALKGSDKQVAWAESIRAKYIAALQAAIDDMPETHKQVGDIVFAAYAAKDDSRYWIDGRGTLIAGATHHSTLSNAMDRAVKQGMLTMDDLQQAANQA